MPLSQCPARPTVPSPSPHCPALPTRIPSEQAPKPCCSRERQRPVLSPHPSGGCSFVEQREMGGHGMVSGATALSPISPFPGSVTFPLSLPGCLRAGATHGAHRDLGQRCLGDTGGVGNAQGRAARLARGSGELAAVPREPGEEAGAPQINNDLPVPWHGQGTLLTPLWAPDGHGAHPGHPQPAVAPCGEQSSPCAPAMPRGWGSSCCWRCLELAARAESSLHMGELQLPLCPQHLLRPRAEAVPSWRCHSVLGALGWAPVAPGLFLVCPLLRGTLHCRGLGSHLHFQAFPGHEHPQGWAGLSLLGWP